MKVIKFIKVGRNDWCGQAPVPDGADADAIAEIAQAVASRHLLSRFPDTEYNAEENLGSIFAGFRCVGMFTVEEQTP